MNKVRPQIRLVVTGGRTYADSQYVSKVLRYYKALADSLNNVLVVVQGGAQGLDTLVRNWCKKNGVCVFTCDALWEFYDKPAGPIRNGWMLEFWSPTHGFVFPGDRGTQDMRAKMESWEGLVVRTHEDFS
jgi:hypothetical protein